MRNGWAGYDLHPIHPHGFLTLVRHFLTRDNLPPVKKDVLAFLCTDEPIALVWIEPLDHTVLLG